MSHLWLEAYDVKAMFYGLELDPVDGQCRWVGWLTCVLLDVSACKLHKPTQ